MPDRRLLRLNHKNPSTWRARPVIDRYIHYTRRHCSSLCSFAGSAILTAAAPERISNQLLSAIKVSVAGLVAFGKGRRGICSSYWPLDTGA